MAPPTSSSYRAPFSRNGLFSGVVKAKASPKFHKNFDLPVDFNKVDLAKMKQWVSSEISRRLGFEDEIVISMVHTALDDKSLNPKEMQTSLEAFMKKKARAFMEQLWSFLLSAQNSEHGMPSELVEAEQQLVEKSKKELEAAAAAAAAAAEKISKQLHQKIPELQVAARPRDEEPEKVVSKPADREKERHRDHERTRRRDDSPERDRSRDRERRRDGERRGYDRHRERDYERDRRRDRDSDRDRVRDRRRYDEDDRERGRYRRGERDERDRYRQRRRDRDQDYRREDEEGDGRRRRDKHSDDEDRREKAGPNEE